MTRKQRNAPPLKPQNRREIQFKGARFWTMNMGAPDPMTGKWVWYATGAWAHDQDDGYTVHCCLAGAIGSRFGLRTHPARHCDGSAALEWAEKAMFLAEVPA